MQKIINILLFCYGISIGLPDIAVKFLSTRLRLDDGVLMILFLCLFIDWRGYLHSLTKSQLKFLKLEVLFAAFCLLSLCVTLALGLPFDSYSLLRMLGCVFILITITAALKSSETIKWLGWGMAIGGGLIVLQIAVRWYGATGITSMARFGLVKVALGFKKWNPNTTGGCAIIFTFMTALVSCEMSGIKKIAFWLLAGVFSLIPLFLFSRGAMAAIGVAWLIFILLARQNRLLKAVIVIMLFVGIAIWLSIYESKPVRSAVYINLSTGQGLTNHDIRWRTAFDLIAESPLIGHGFGQEARLFGIRIDSDARADNVFLCVLVEGGLLGLILFIWPLGYLGCRLWKLAHGKDYDTRAVICLAFLLGILVLNLSQSSLYWTKLQTLILSLMVVCLGSNDFKQQLCRKQQ